MGYFSPSGGSAAGGTASEVTILPTGTVKSLFGQVLAVASNSTQAIVSYTVPVGKSAYLLGMEMSGTNIATYDVLYNASQFSRHRTYFSGPFVVQVQIGSSVLDAFPLVAGDVITINVTNFRPDAGDFEARVQYIEV